MLIALSAMSAVFLLLLVGLLIGVTTLYNKLVGLRNEVRNAWAQIDVQLKRRHDLIPNLVDTVKGYLKHERETLEAVIKARQQVVAFHGSLSEQAQLENTLSQTLKSLFALSESYPELQANPSFLQLQDELAHTENRIGFARQYYNDTVMHFNNAVEMFPGNLVAGLFQFRAAESFTLSDAAERAVPRVSF